MLSPRTPLPAPEIAEADLADAVTSRWRGYVDGWDPVRGIHGWALLADAPIDPVQLELVVGETPFARVETGLARSDIDTLLGVRGSPGFGIAPQIFARFARLRARRRDTPVRVRFAGTAVYLAGRAADPTVGELVDLWCRHLLSTFTDTSAEIGPGDRLLARLANWRVTANAFRDLPLSAAPERSAGHIDYFFLSPAGQLWFIGWLPRGTDTEWPFLLIDQQPYPGAAAVLHYPRPDLDSRLIGVIGVMDTAWSPPATVREFYLHAGPGAELQIRANLQTQAIGREAFLAEFQRAQTTPVAGPAGALGALVMAGQNWLPGNAAAAGIAAEARVDRLLMIPGFGCLAEGWTLAPTKQVDTFEMRLSDTLLVADSVSTYFRPRPDLAGVLGEGSVVHAGFVTVLRGDLPDIVTGAPLLRVLYTDGTSSVHPVDPKHLRGLDWVADSAEVLRLFPSLRHEAFYPDILDALRRQLAARTVRPRPIVVNPAARAVVIRLPSMPENQRYCFDCISQYGALDSTVGLCVVADNALGLTAAKLWFHELENVVDSPLSLFYLDDAAASLAALPLTLAELAADRFVYVDRGAMLTVEGWDAVFQSVNRAGHGVHYFEFIDDNAAPDRIHGVLSASCFGWTTAALFAWLPTAPKFVRGLRDTNGLPSSGLDHVFPGAAMRVEVPPFAPLADMIDQDLMRHHEARA